MNLLRFVPIISKFLMKPNPWNQIDYLATLPSPYDEIRKLTPEEREAIKKRAKKEQREFETQKKIRILDNKRNYGLITEEEYNEEVLKDLKQRRLEDLKRYGNNLREEENRTNQSFFEFREPLPGCKYNIGKARGEIIIPMNQTNLSMFYSEIYRNLLKP